MSNKNKNKAKKSSKSTLALVQEILGVIGGIVGSIMVIYGFIKTFRDDVSGFIWLLFLGGAIWLIVLWQMFQRLKTYAYIFLSLTIIGGVASWIGWQSQVRAKEGKLIVVIAKFDGPEEVYGIRNEIVEKLNASFVNDDEIIVLAINETVAPDKGSSYARELGGKYQADIVVWGWYRPTKNPNVTIHIENLSFENFIPNSYSATIEPLVTLDDLESFSFQQQISHDTTALITMLKGIIQYESKNYTQALDLFTAALKSIEIDQFFSVDVGATFYYRGNCHAFLRMNREAIEDYNHSIEFGLEDAKVYNNRGASYYAIGQYDNAFEDFNKAITMHPDYISGYINRGV